MGQPNDGFEATLDDVIVDDNAPDTPATAEATATTAEATPATEAPE